MSSAAEVVARWAARGELLRVAEASTTAWREGDGPPVLCLHGVPVSAFLYRRLLPELAARGLQGVALDFPGLGLAERPRDFDYRWSGLAAWTLDALDALGLDRVHLVVHDIGGPVGFDVARRAPERIASLTALNTFARVATFRRPAVMEPFAHPIVGKAYLRATTPWMFERLMRAIGYATPVPAEEVRAHLLLLRRVDGGRAFLRIMRSFERTEAFEAGVVRALSERRFPAQVAWGERDPALPMRRHGEDVRAVLGVEEIHALPARHFVPEDAPAAVADLVAARAGT